MKVSHETGSEANFGFGRALMPSYLEMLPPEAAFFSFWMQPRCDEVDSLKFKPSIRMWKKGDLCDFERGMVVGARRTG